MRQININVVVLLFFILCWLNMGSLEAQEASKPQPVEVTTPKRGTISQELIYTGSIAADAQVEVSANMPGKVIELKVDEGDRVKKGDALALTDSTELLFAAKQAEAALRAAQAQLATTEALAQIRVESQVATAKAALNAAQTQLEQAKALSYMQTKIQLEQAEAGVAAAKANLKKTREGARQQEKEQTKAAVEHAKVGLEHAKLSFDRAKQLYENEAVSKQDFDGAKAQYDGAKAQYDGAVEQLSLVEEGARTEDIVAVEAQVRQAEASRDLAKLAVDTKDWEKKIALAESQVGQAEAGFLSAKALEDTRSWEHEIEIARTQVAQAQEGHNLAKKRLDDATITSPIDGTVAVRSMDVGDYAQTPSSPSGKPLFTIVHMDVVKAVFTIPEGDLDKFSTGGAVLISIASGNEDITGEVNFISPVVNPEDRTVTVKATIPNPDHELRPGMFIEVRVKTSERTNALLLPRSAVLDTRNDSGYVFIAENGKASQRKVRIGMVWGDRAEIIEGISDSDTVIVNGQRGLQDGTTISVVKK
jgi:RND family efflux transporter MFP subunit